MESLLNLGRVVSEVIFSVASLLTRPELPGLISFLLMSGIFLFAVFFIRKSRGHLLTLIWLEREIGKTTSEADFCARAIDINKEINERRQDKGYANIVAAWDEYGETLVLDETEASPVYRNSVRPSSFFNMEDLHYGPGFYRHLPSIFVSVGLFLTFLGLISALTAISNGLSVEATPEEMRAALDELLGAVSAKFIMSLTGLLASILFTVVLRICMGKIEEAIHRLCGEIEKRLSFVSLEELMLKQIAIAKSQEESFARIGFELVEKLGEPLRKEVPNTIATAITSAFNPLMDRVGTVSADGLGHMVNDLSSRFSDDVGHALSQASGELSAAGEKIALLVDRMDQSSGRMGQEMESSIARLASAAEELSTRMSGTAERTEGAFSTGTERLLSVMNQTLDGIRSNTAEGASAMQAAAADMRASASSFREQLEAAAESGSQVVRNQMQIAGSAVSEAGEGLINSVTQSGSELLSASGVFSEKLRHELLEPVKDIAGVFEQMTNRLRDGAGLVASAAGNIQAGGEASRHAAEALSSASRELQATTLPIKGSVERIEGAVTKLSRSTEQTSQIMIRNSKESAESTARILGAAHEALGGEQKLLQTTLEKLADVLRRMEVQRDQVDSLDEKLGDAFEEFTRHVHTAVDELFSHVQTMNRELAPAIDKMHEIVDRAEKFIPETRR